MILIAILNRFKNDFIQHWLCKYREEWTDNHDADSDEREHDSKPTDDLWSELTTTVE